MSIYIDTETGTWGDAEKLVISEHIQTNYFDGCPDSEIVEYGETYGVTLEDYRNGAVEEYMGTVVEFDGELKDTVFRLYFAAEAILEALSVDPSDPCKLCDTSFGFHTSECATHDLNVATDAVAEWVR